MKWLLVLTLIFLPFNVHAAGAYLGSGDGGHTNVSSSHSASVTIPANTDLFIVLAFRTILDVNSPAAPTACTVAGNSMTDVGQSPTGDQNSEWIKMYFYLTPPTGVQTVACSGGGGVALDTGYFWAAYSGFSQTGQPDSSGKTNKTTTTALAISTTVVGAKCWSIVNFANQGSTPTSYTNGTSRIYGVPNDGVGIVDSNGIVATGAYTITVNQPSNISNGINASFCESTATAGFNFSNWWDF